MQAAINQQGLIQQRFPPAKDGEGLAHDSLLAIDRQAEVGELTVASLAKNAGKEMNFVAGIFIRPERLEREATQLLANNLAVKVEGGYLEDIIRQEPTKVVSYDFNGKTVERPLSDVIQGKIQSSEELNRVYSALNDELFTDLKAGRDPILFLKADEKTRNVINTRALRYGDKLTKNAIEHYNSLKLQSVLLGDSPEEVAKNAVKYITESGLNPTLGHGAAISSITSTILPNVSDPVAFAKAIGELEFSDHMPGVKIKETPFHKELKSEAERLQVRKRTQYRTQQKQIGNDKALEYLENAVSDGTTFSAAEYKSAAEYSQNLYDNQSITFEAKRAFDTAIDESYTQKRDNKAVIAELDELADNLDLPQTRINNEFRAGNIDKDKAEELSEKIDTFANLKGSDGKPITGDSVKGIFGLLADTRVSVSALAGEAKSYTVFMVKDASLVKYKAKFKELSETIADPQVRHEQAVMSTVEWVNSLELVEDENGVTHFKDYHTSFTTTKYPKQPTRTADEVGQELRGDGVSRLDDPEYKVIDVNVPVYQRQIESGKPLKPTAYDQAVADAAGIPFHELLNRRFDALGIKDVKATEGSFGILQRESIISPGVKRLLDGPKTFNKISSAIDRSPTLMPAQTGTGAVAFNTMDSVFKKLNTANSEALTAVWLLQTDEGRNQPNLTPLQQAIQLTEQYPGYAKSIIPYGQIASTDPKVAVALSKYADSHRTFSGTSKSISRLQTVALKQPLPEGPLQGLTYADIKDAIFGASGEAVHGTKDVPLVIASILNRVADPRYPNTVQEVINEKGQYEAVYKGNSKYMPELETYYSSPQGQQDIADAFNALQGRTDYKGQTQLHNRGEGDVMGDPLGNFFHYANQTGFGPYTGEVPTHYQQYLR